MVARCRRRRSGRREASTTTDIVRVRFRVLGATTQTVEVPGKVTCAVSTEIVWVCSSTLAVDEDVLAKVGILVWSKDASPYSIDLIWWDRIAYRRCIIPRVVACEFYALLVIGFAFNGTLTLRE